MTTQVKETQLVGTPEVLRLVGLKSDDHPWTKWLKPLLISKYGMRRIENAGYRILGKNLNQFFVDFGDGKIFMN